MTERNCEFALLDSTRSATWEHVAMNGSPSPFSAFSFDPPVKVFVRGGGALNQRTNAHGRRGPTKRQHAMMATAVNRHG